MSDREGRHSPGWAAGGCGRARHGRRPARSRRGMRNPRGGVALLLAVAALLPVGAAQAQSQDSPLPSFGRYKPLYPGQYLHLAYTQTDGDEYFDAESERRDGALPTYGPSALPREDLRAELSWHFPLFETYALPFISSRMWRARVQLGYARTEAEGAVAEFARDESDDEATFADDLATEGSGLTDLRLALGTYLFGAPSSGWREGRSGPASLLAELALTVNTGEYERNTPVNAGHNTPAVHALLGLHWSPWAGGFIDAGLRYGAYIKNQDPTFGAQAPAQVGDTLSWDVSLAQRLWPGAYLSVYGQGFDRESNRYENPRFAPNPPTPPPGSDAIPAPGNYRDDGVERRSIGAGFDVFLSQRLTLGLHYTRPISGRSGQFDLDYNFRVPEGCFTDAVGCTLLPAGSVPVDGLEAGRALAADRISLSLRFHFLERDTFDCVGCSS